MVSEGSASVLLQAVWGVGELIFLRTVWDVFVELMPNAVVSSMVKKILHGLLGGRFTKSGQRLGKNFAGKC